MNRAIIKGFAYHRSDSAPYGPAIHEFTTWCVINQPYTPSGADHGSPAKQKVTFEARYAPLAQCTDSARYRSGIHHWRNPSASPHQPQRLLPWPPSAEEQVGSLSHSCTKRPAATACVARAFFILLQDCCALLYWPRGQYANRVRWRNIKELQSE